MKDWSKVIYTLQECQTDTKYAHRISGKFNGIDNIFGNRIFNLESRYR